MISIGKKNKKAKEDKKGEREGTWKMSGRIPDRVSTGQFPCSIDGPPSGNENFVYRVVANYSADRRHEAKRGAAVEDFIRGKAAPANCNP